MIEFKDKIDQAVETIRGYCAKVKSCGNCRYSDQKGNCPFTQETPPCDWDMDSQGRRFIMNWNKAQPEADK